ncbi:DUF4209 domain-containing protein [Paraburkholderia domus]|uniref:DUF4209 domain-containing protein n=1 Tax=Paraburkholderia domus TaxID=2793075 RepID=UPI001EF11B10|nr:DUF4209 domain-containing protein [Paraburkholderia domus]
MITHATRTYPFLDSTSEDTVYALARLMIDVEFMSDRSLTPARASLEFLREIGRQKEVLDRIVERDFVFAIKMFGLNLRNEAGLLLFQPRNDWVRDGDEDGSTAVEVTIDNQSQAKEAEFAISDVQKHRKVHSRRIEAALNRLLRRYRDVELAREFVSLVNDGKSIGEAKDVLRTRHNVKDHEYNRVRETALEIGIFDPSSRRKRTHGRVTLEPEVMAYVEQAAKTTQGSRLHQKTPSQMVNQMLRDLHYITEKKHLVPQSSGIRTVRSGK